LEGGRLLLAAPGPDEVTIDIAARSREAFELLFHRAGTKEFNPHSRTGFSLLPDKEYSLKLVAYANEVRPTKPTYLEFKWDGSESGLSSSVRQG
jgi:hypothetical protein